jgi:predicted component of type VI protein secretion system
MQTSLLVVRGPTQEQTLPIRGLEFCIGRDSSCDVCVTSMMISRRHAALVIFKGRILVRDLGSRNGTYVNGKAVVAECELGHDDRLRLGPLEYRVQLELPAVPDHKPCSAGTLDEQALATVGTEEKTANHRALPANPAQANAWQVLVSVPSSQGADAPVSRRR